HFFFRGEVADDVRCLYTDGEAWKMLHGFDQMIKHMIAGREDLLREHPELKDKLLKVFRASFSYSERHLDEIGDAFIQCYGGDQEALLAWARCPKIEFTFTVEEAQLTEAEAAMADEVGQILGKAA